MILFDVTTSYTFRHWNAMGLLRVEHEAIRAFRDACGEGVTFVIYHAEQGCFFPVDDDEIDALIADRKWSVPAVERAGAARNRLRSLARQVRFLAALPRIRGMHRADGAAGGYLRQQALTAQLARLSLADYSALRRVLGWLCRLWPGLPPYLQRLDLINHRIHVGEVDARAAARFHPDRAVDFARVAHYVSVGGFWSDDRYKAAWQARETHGCALHYLICDLVPVLWRHVTEPTTKETFPLALHWVLWGADQIWTISRTTRDDLLGHIAENGYPQIAPDRVTPVYLGSDIETGPAAPEDEAAILARHDLARDGFVLMVGTQEPRKNHDFAYRLWRELNRRNPGAVPPLVWAGQPGWSIGPLLDQVAGDTGLPHGAIRILSDVSDAELAVLYRACRFTVYPSYYEGWGLPVVESLAYGKPCIASDAPSLIEAGQGACDHIPTIDGESWIVRMMELIGDDGAYHAACQRAAAFRGHSWQGFRAALIADFQRFSERRLGAVA